VQPQTPGQQRYQQGTPVPGQGVPQQQQPVMMGTPLQAGGQQRYGGPVPVR
jgi:hypothetical protein